MAFSGLQRATLGFLGAVVVHQAEGILCAQKTVSSTLFHVPCMQLPELNSRKRDVGSFYANPTGFLHVSPAPQAHPLGNFVLRVPPLECPSSRAWQD